MNTFFDIEIGDEPAGRIVFKLFDEAVPKTVENFRCSLLILSCSIFSRFTPAELFAPARKDLDTKDQLFIESFLAS